MAPRDLPPADFAARSLELKDEPPRSVWRRIYDAKYANPLGFGRSLSRFGDPSGRRFGLIYLASTAKGAFAETVLRDRAVGTMRPFLISMAELESYVCADIEIKQSLKIVDLTGDGHIRLRIPTDVTRASNQTLARVWSEAFYNQVLSELARMLGYLTRVRSTSLVADKWTLAALSVATRVAQQEHTAAT